MKNSTQNSAGTWLNLSARLTVVVALMLSATNALGSTTSISGLIGHPVVTDSGERLGNVEDFALDPETGKVSFVVISIGSFLIENSLIAVQPEALAPAADGEPLVLRTEDLEVAHRFNADNWPSAADVRAIGTDTNSATSTAESSTALTATGTATITAGNRTATFEGGKREIVNGPMRRSKPAAKPTNAAAAKSRVIPNFKNLDSNRDGRLSRAEIGAQLNQKSGFGDLDADANGSIDDFEYAAYLERRAKTRRWVGNR